MKIASAKEILKMSEKQAKIKFAKLQSEFKTFEYEIYRDEGSSDETMETQMEELKITSQIFAEVKKELRDKK